MKKIAFLLMFIVGALFAQVDFQTATKEQLMNIKGIGAKKAEAIIEHRKTNQIKSVEDLSKIKGFGDALIKKIKETKM